MQKKAKKVIGILMNIVLAVMVFSMYAVKTKAIETKTLRTGQLYRIITKGGSVIDIPDGHPENGVLAQLYAIYPGNSNQYYYIELAEDGGFYIRSAYSNKVLEIGGFRTDCGATVNQWDQDINVSNQIWELEASKESGWLLIKNRGSQLYLNVKNNDHSNGNQLIQYYNDGTDACLFAFLPVSEADQQISHVTATVNQVSNLKVRSLPDTASNVLHRLRTGEKVTVIARCGDWYQILLGNGYGFVHGDYITLGSEPSNSNGTDAFTGVVNVSSNLKVRSGPGTEYPVTGRLYNGNSVEIVATSNNWGMLKSGGYVCLDYIVRKSESAGNTDSKQLPMQHFYQNQGAWANAKLGNSTYAKIGCCVTALAMAESYRNGTTIYPNDPSIAVFTSGGALCSARWNSYRNNKVLFSSRDELGFYKIIYDMIKNNKPVILCLDKTSDGSHFVVVNGFDNADYNNLSSQNFTILDPDSGKDHSRLSDYLNTGRYVIYGLYYL